LTEQEIHHLLTLNDEMQRKILQSRQTGGQEHEFKEGVQIPRGAVQQPENLENIQFTIQPGQHLDFSQLLLGHNFLKNVINITICVESYIIQFCFTYCSRKMNMNVFSSIGIICSKKY
jgi:hypothetical protein